MSRGDEGPPVALGVLAALPAEGEALRRALSDIDSPSPGANLFVGRVAGRRVAVAVSGVGRARAEATARLLIETYRPGALLVAGVAGALGPGLRRNELVVSPRVRRGLHSGSVATPGAPDEVLCDQALVEAACWALRGAALDFVAADCLTVDRPLITVREKTEAWNRLGAGIVDMEGYWVGLLAREHGVPFLLVRSVLDRAEEALPPFVRAWGRPEDSRKVVRRLLARPWEAPEALLLGRRLARAVQRLTAFLQAFAPSLSWMA